jgi:hypothetical protein
MTIMVILVRTQIDLVWHTVVVRRLITVLPLQPRDAPHDHHGHPGKDFGLWLDRPGVLYALTTILMMLMTSNDDHDDVDVDDDRD